MKNTKKSNKQAKFFCESCGSEVPRNARTCPTCGKFFASVRCPKCGKTGSTEDFKKGCPACGYAVHPENGNGRYGYSSNNGNSGIFKGLLGGSKKKNRGSDGPLPIWIYVVCIAILISLVVLLYSCL